MEDNIHSEEARARFRYLSLARDLSCERKSRYELYDDAFIQRLE